MYCPNCGATINENAEFCVNCGVNINKFLNKQTTNPDDSANIWVNLLSLCCFPIVGIVLYFIWKDKQPKAAKSALIFGLIGFAIQFIFGIISALLGFIAEMDDSYYV